MTVLGAVHTYITPCVVNSNSAVTSAPKQTEEKKPAVRGSEQQRTAEDRIVRFSRHRDQPPCIVVKGNRDIFVNNALVVFQLPCVPLFSQTSEPHSPVKIPGV